MDYIRNLIQVQKKSNTESLIQKIKSHWTLNITEGEDKGKSIPLEYNYIPMGRKTEKTKGRFYEIRFEDQTVSSRQAHLVWHPSKGKYGITHIRVPVINSTFVNQTPLEPNEEMILESNYQIQMGNLLMVMVQDIAKSTENLTEIPSIEPSYLPITEEIVYTGFSLKVIEGNEIGFEFPVARRRVSIKRGNKPDKIDANELILSDRTVSRNQARLVWLNEFQRLDVIHSVNATNPTKLIRKIGAKDRIIELAADEPEALQDGDILAMGQTYLYVSEESIEEKIKKIREMEGLTDEDSLEEEEEKIEEKPIPSYVPNNEEAKSMGPRILGEPPPEVPEEIIEEIKEEAKELRIHHDEHAEEKPSARLEETIAETFESLPVYDDISVEEIPEEEDEKPKETEEETNKLVLEVIPIESDEIGQSGITISRRDLPTSVLTKNLEEE